MLNANETGKRALAKELATAVLVLVFGESVAKSATKKEILTELARLAAEKPDLVAEATNNVAAAEAATAAIEPLASPEPGGSFANV